MNRSSLRPLVGVSACLKENGRGGWHHTVGDKYVQAVIRAIGALPIVIPAMGPELGDNAVTEALDRLLDTLDGVLLTGSPSNVEPHHYDGHPSREGTAHDPARDATTLPLIRHTIDRGVPLIAICRGAQEVNVALGGTLHQLVHEVLVVVAREQRIRGLEGAGRALVTDQLQFHRALLRPSMRLASPAAWSTFPKMHSAEADAGNRHVRSTVRVVRPNARPLSMWNV